MLDDFIKWILFQWLFYLLLEFNFVSVVSQIPLNVPRSIVHGTRSTYYDYIGGIDSGAKLKDLLIVADKLTPRIENKTPKYVIKSPWFDIITGLIHCPKTPDEATLHFLLVNPVGITTRRLAVPGPKGSSKMVNVNWKVCCAKSIYKDFGKFLHKIWSSTCE